VKPLLHCGVCGHEKGPGAPCLPCKNRRNAEYAARHPEKVAAAQRARRKAKRLAREGAALARVGLAACIDNMIRRPSK
jgi:hypothetical protein